MTFYPLSLAGDVEHCQAQTEPKGLILAGQQPPESEQRWLSRSGQKQCRESIACYITNWRHELLLGQPHLQDFLRLVKTKVVGGDGMCPRQLTDQCRDIKCLGVEA